LLKELESANNNIKTLRSNEEKHCEILDEREHKIEAVATKSKTQLQKIKTLEEKIRELQSKLVQNEDAISRLMDTNHRQKQHLLTVKSREKSRAAIQKELQEIAEQYQLLLLPDELAESPLHVLECLIDKFGGNADHLQYLKLCKTLRNRLLKDEKKTVLANQIVKLMTNNKKHP